MRDVVREISPRGPGAVSVLRVEGRRSIAAVVRLAPRAKLVPGSIELTRLSIGGEDLDEALVCTLFPEVVELHLHASPPLVAKVRDFLEQAIGTAAREPEEPASIEGRAWRLLADAASEAGARILLDQTQGALRRELVALESCTSAERARRIDDLCARARTAGFALQPATVVLAGPVNAGKSTLFNVLVGERRAIVSAEAGTTRDLIEERVQLGAWPCLLIDSAGERALEGRKDHDSPPESPIHREPARAIEAAGQQRARQARERADFVFWLAAPDSPMDVGAVGDVQHAVDVRRDGRAPPVRLSTCADRLAPRERALAENPIAALVEPEAARARVIELFRRTFDLPEDPWAPGAPVPFEQDQLALLERLRARVSDASFTAVLNAWLARR